MHWVIYDISKNDVRSKVASLCKDFGLSRVQKSSFLGLITKNHAEMLCEKAKEFIEEGNCIFFIPNCSGCFGKKIIVGTFDEERFKEKAFLVI